VVFRKILCIKSPVTSREIHTCLTLTVLSVRSELISRWTVAGKRSRCVATVVLTAAVVHRAFVHVCHRQRINTGLVQKIQNENKVTFYFLCHVMTPVVQNGGASLAWHCLRCQRHLHESLNLLRPVHFHYFKSSSLSYHHMANQQHAWY